MVLLGELRVGVSLGKEVSTLGGHGESCRVTSGWMARDSSRGPAGLPVTLARSAPICPAHCHALQVLRLLITAWERRLIFTIGTSNTTGESDTVVWNEIHHKTEFGSNLTGHGYPDASYLDNVLAELTAQGVSEAVAKA